MVNRLKTIFFLSAALLPAAFIVPAASAETIGAEAGTVRAEVDYAANAYGFLEFGNLRVYRETVLVHDAPIAACGDIPCTLSGDPADPELLRVTDLDLDGEPEVLLRTYTGGAHCCFVADVLVYQPATGGYAVVTRDFGDAGWQLTDLEDDLRFEFVGADARFGYRFTAFAYSGMPIQIFRFTGGAFKNVSKTYPARLRADARSWKRLIKRGLKRGKRRSGADLRGFYAAWTADMCRLGQARAARRELNMAARRKWLNTDTANDIGKRGRAYVKDLFAFLKRTGYRC